MMRKFILLLMFIIPSTVLAHDNALPNFTSLVEEHGAAVVNISATKKNLVNGHQVLPEIPNIPENSPLYEFFRRHMEHSSHAQGVDMAEIGADGLEGLWQDAKKQEKRD